MYSQLLEFADEAFSFVEALETVDTTTALAYEIGRGLRRFGFDNFVITLLPNAGQSIQDAILVARLPEEWPQIYSDRNFLRHDPVFRHCQSARQPFAWSDVPVASEPNSEAAEVMLRASEQGMHDGFCLPIHGLSGLEGCASFSGEAPDLTHRVRPVVHLMALHAFVRSRQLSKRQRDRSLLTPRERQVLTMAAQGYSAYRTASLLGIAERTVTAHVVSACGKLKAANKTAAVAQAIFHGHISL